MVIGMKEIAKIYTDFPEKFGVPRQSGLVEELEGKIVFESDFRSKDAVKGLEDFSHIWLIWGFSENESKPFSPTVRPPRLGGNKRLGVFATRSPFRPNPIGLSSLKIKKIDLDCSDAPVIYVSGADMVNGTPIYDIKPYISGDIHQNAVCGFEENVEFKKLEVIIPDKYKAVLKDKFEGLKKVLENNPVPAYHSDKDRIYGMAFASKQVKFKTDGRTLEVIEII